MVVSLLWKGMTRNGALAGMLTGAIVVLVWKQFGWFGLYEMVPGFALATLAILVVSRLGAPPPTSVQRVFEAVDREYRAAT